MYMVWSVYGYTIFNEPKDRSDTEVWLSTKLKVLTMNRKDKSDNFIDQKILISDYHLHPLRLLIPQYVLVEKVVRKGVSLLYS